MHDRIISRFTDWAERELPSPVTPAQALRHAKPNDLDPEAVAVLEHLPDRAYDRFELIELVQENLVLKLGKASATMRGFGGSA